MPFDIDGPAAALPLRVPPWAAHGLDGGRDVSAAHAGAALAPLDAAVRAGVPFAGAWAERLGLAAAAVALARTGRPEDEAALRDLVAFSPGPPAGPAAPVAQAYLRLASGGWTDLPPLVAGLGARSGSTADDLTRALADAVDAPCPLAAAETALGVAAAARPGRDALALWAADVTLARWFGWPHGVPLVTLGLPAGAVPVAGDGRLAGAVLRGAMRALDRFVHLGRHAAALQAVRPRLRARPAGRVVDRMLARDALSVAGVRDLIPERAARRLFDRLVALGAIRELSGRPANRLYGL